MIVTKFRIEVDGEPVRLYINSKTALRCAEPDAQNYTTFSSQSDAEKRAALWELGAYTVVPFHRDVGTPTKLTEIGL